MNKNAYSKNRDFRYTNLFCFYVTVLQHIGCHFEHGQFSIHTVQEYQYHTLSTVTDRCACTSKRGRMVAILFIFVAIFPVIRYSK